MLVQCHITRTSSSNFIEEATRSNFREDNNNEQDKTVVRLMRLASPATDTPETILRCLADSNKNSTNNKTGGGDPFLAPLQTYLDQANLHFIAFNASSSSSQQNNNDMKTSSSGDESETGNKSGSGGLTSQSIFQRLSHLNTISDDHKNKNKQGKKVPNRVEVQVYPAFSDGGRDTSSGGALDLRHPLIPQLQLRSGIPLLSKTSSSSVSTNNNNSIISLAIIILVEDSDSNKQQQQDNRRSEKTGGLSLKRHVSPTSSAAKKTNVDDETENETETQKKQELGKQSSRLKRQHSSIGRIKKDGTGEGSLTFVEPGVSGSQNQEQAKYQHDDEQQQQQQQQQRKTQKKAPNFFANDNYEYHPDDYDNDENDEYDLSFRSDGDEYLQYDDDQRQQQRQQQKSSQQHQLLQISGNFFLDKNSVVRDSKQQQRNSYLSPKQLQVRRRRLQHLREENLLRLEEKRQQEESKRKFHAEEYEKERQERRMKDRDLKHQAELAKNRQDTRASQLHRKEQLYETREYDIDCERKEFNKRLADAHTLRQIELLKIQTERSNAASVVEKAQVELLQQQQASIALTPQQQQSIIDGENLENNGNNNDANNNNNSGSNIEQQFSASPSSPFSSSSTNVPPSVARLLNSSTSYYKRKHVTLSKKLTDNLDKTVEDLVHKSSAGDSCMHDLEAQRQQQRDDQVSQYRLTELMSKLERKKKK